MAGTVKAYKVLAANTAGNFVLWRDRAGPVGQIKVPFFPTMDGIISEPCLVLIASNAGWSAGFTITITDAETGAQLAAASPAGAVAAVAFELGSLANAMGGEMQPAGGLGSVPTCAQLAVSLPDSVRAVRISVTAAGVGIALNLVAMSR